MLARLARFVRLGRLGRPPVRLARFVPQTLATPQIALLVGSARPKASASDTCSGACPCCAPGSTAAISCSQTASETPSTQSQTGMQNRPGLSGGVPPPLQANRGVRRAPRPPAVRGQSAKPPRPARLARAVGRLPQVRQKQPRSRRALHRAALHPSLPLRRRRSRPLSRLRRRGRPPNPRARPRRRAPRRRTPHRKALRRANRVSRSRCCLVTLPLPPAGPWATPLSSQTPSLPWP